MILQKVRSRIILSSLIIGFAIIIGYFSLVLVTPNEIEAYTNANLIRFHVLANSNDPADQNLKLKVRDAILVATHDIFPGVAEKEEAKTLISANWDLLYDVATTTIKNSGYDYDVQIQLGTYAFPDRDYGDIHLPEGDYEALRIIIGEGRGENWWCVLFPPLCFIDLDATGEQNPSVEISPELAEGTIEFRTHLWEEFKVSTAAKQLEEWWLTSLELANSVALPLLKLK